MDTNSNPVMVNKKDNVFETSNRKDLGYSSEVNSCDSGQDIPALEDGAPSACMTTDESLAALKLELEKAKLELQRKSLEYDQLEVIKKKVESEIEDLTTSLFEEANKMVYEANLLRNKAEKKLAAAEGKNDALEIEIEALKALVITSTPSNPNPKSHPQLIKKPETSPIRMKLHKSRIIFEVEKRKMEIAKHKPKISEFKLVQANSPVMAVYKLQKNVQQPLFQEVSLWQQDFLESLSSKTMASTGFCACPLQSDTESPTSPLSDCEALSRSAFLRTIYKDDVSLCLRFANHDLAREVSSSIHRNSLSVELACPGEAPTEFCELSETEAPCKHSIRLSDQGTCYKISQSTRNKLTSVCNFFTYLRYVRQGIVKHDAEQAYWKINDLRADMAFARLGFHKEQV